MRDGIDRAALQELLADSGVKVTSEEADVLARSLARIRIAAMTLLRATPFDETSERFYRLLEMDAAEDGGK